MARAGKMLSHGAILDLLRHRSPQGSLPYRVCRVSPTKGAKRPQSDRLLVGRLPLQGRNPASQSLPSSAAKAGAREHLADQMDERTIRPKPRSSKPMKKSRRNVAALILARMTCPIVIPASAGAVQSVEIQVSVS